MHNTGKETFKAKDKSIFVKSFIESETGRLNYKLVLFMLFISVIIVSAFFIYGLVAEKDNIINAQQAELISIKEEKALLEETLELLSKQPQQNEAADQVFEYQGLVEVRDIDNTIEVELIYATEANFSEHVLYTLEVCLLRRQTADKLAAANAEFSENGYRIKVWDAYRPRSVQGLMFKHYPDPVFVADPAVGSNHNRGTSVDVTLVDRYGNELKMPTKFDDFSEKASRNYADMTEEARKNVDYLTEVMIRHGFEPINSEWWHFNDSEMKNYDHLDISFEDWVSAYFSGKQQ